MSNIPCDPLSSGRVGLVLAGGAARGAYEVGVVSYILEDVANALGREVPIDILCGTSVGALNACFLAGYADEPRGRADRLKQHWTGLTLRDVVHTDSRLLFDTIRGLFGRPHYSDDGQRRGGILDPTGIERVVGRALDFKRIGENIRAGRLYAITLSTTHVGSGRTVVFVERRDGGLPKWTNDPTVEARAVEIRAEHALASAAIPFLFPAVKIDGEFYCDGGLRQNVPLSPARRLGADGLIVVSPRFIQWGSIPPKVEKEREQAFPGPLFLLGKALNALLLDRVENDIDRLDRINRILMAGCKVYGPGFLDAINKELGNPESDLRTRPLMVVLIRASQDIGRLAAEFVRSPRFPKRAPGAIGRLMRRVAESAIEADLLSYLLFDGDFAQQLIELGRADAQKRHEELCGFFSQIFEAQARNSQ